MRDVENLSPAKEENEKLLRFLEKSEHYSPESLLASIQISGWSDLHSCASLLYLLFSFNVMWCVNITECWESDCVCVWGAEFYEERAVLLGRVGDHEKALAIYTSHVRDRTKAEEYCKRHYDPSKEPNKDVRTEPNWTFFTQNLILI